MASRGTYIAGGAIPLRHPCASCDVGRMGSGELCDGAVCHVWTIKERRAYRPAPAAAFVQAVRRARAIGGVFRGAPVVLDAKARRDGGAVVDGTREVCQCPHSM